MQTWYLAEKDGIVICPERVVQLTPKAADVLACLLRHKGDTVPIKTFLDEVWVELNVTPDLIREYVSDLRAALHDDPRRPRYIETVRGKGYRLIGDVELADAETISGKANRFSENRATIAVLKPVASGGAQLRAFADDLSSEIINHLARFHDIGVVARHSSFAAEHATDLRVFARDVNADYILESSLAHFGTAVRVRFQLVDAETGRTAWAERFDLAEALAPDEADRIAGAVVMALTGWHGELHRAQFKTINRKRETNLNAFEHFILGCDLELRFDAASLGQTIHHLECSVDLDPTFGRAWLVLALELQWAFDVMPGRDTSYLERSAQAFEHAFMLAPADPVTLAIYALKVAREGQLADAIGMLEKAAASMDGDADAMVCVATSRAVISKDIGAARALFDAAFACNPTPPSWYYFVEARIAFLNREYDRCIKCSHLGPQQISAMIFRTLSHAMRGEVELARIAYDDLMAAYPESDFVQFADYFPIANPVRRAEYDAAVTRLMDQLEDTGENWPVFPTQAAE